MQHQQMHYSIIYVYSRLHSWYVNGCPKYAKPPMEILKVNYSYGTSSQSVFQRAVRGSSYYEKNNIFNIIRGLSGCSLERQSFPFRFLFTAILLSFLP